MAMKMMPMCKQTQALPNVPLSIGGGHSHKLLDVFNGRRQKDKVVIVMGATGTGKSKLSIDLATRFPAEIINSDKMQFYEGLDIATNKITPQEQRGVPHHLLGILDPNDDFSGGGHSHKLLDVFNGRRQKDKVVIVMGATGTGKSKLSIDLATRFPAEIINSDKMQFYEGLDIATNKITPQEQRGVPHHLLGILDPNDDFSADNFSDVTCVAVKSILNRKRLPIIVGGSNSYIEKLVDGYNNMFRSRYDLCLIWVDVSLPVLHSFVSDRVDQMVENGMVEEVREFFDPNADYTKGIRRAIGVPEFDVFFRYGPYLDEETRDKLLEQAKNAVKDNTCKLAFRQLEKIRRLRNKGWSLHQLDATEVFRKRGKESHEAWDRLVSGPTSMIVRQFLYNVKAEVPTNLPAIRVPAKMETPAFAAATY